MSEIKRNISARNPDVETENYIISLLTLKNRLMKGDYKNSEAGEQVMNINLALSEFDEACIKRLETIAVQRIKKR